MSSLQAYTTGLRIAAQRCWLVVVLFLATLLFGLIGMVLSWSWLATTLDHSLPTRTLLADLDVNVFVDLFAHHRESFALLTRVAVGLAILFAVCGVWLNAAVIVSVREGGSVRDCLRRAVTLYPAHLGMWIAASALHAIGVVTIVLAARQLSRWTAESPSELTAYWIIAAGALLVAAWMTTVRTVHDHARIYNAASGSGPARALLWATRFVVRHAAWTLPLTLLLLGTGTLIWLIYQTIAMLMRADSPVGLAISLSWGQLWLWARMFLRVGTFGAATELQRQAASPK